MRVVVWFAKTLNTIAPGTRPALAVESKRMFEVVYLKAKARVSAPIGVRDSLTNRFRAHTGVNVQRQTRESGLTAGSFGSGKWAYRFWSGVGQRALSGRRVRAQRCNVHAGFDKTARASEV